MLHCESRIIAHIYTKPFVWLRFEEQGLSQCPLGGSRGFSSKNALIGFWVKMGPFTSEGMGGGVMSLWPMHLS